MTPQHIPIKDNIFRRSKGKTSLLFFIVMCPRDNLLTSYLDLDGFYSNYLPVMNTSGLMFIDAHAWGTVCYLSRGGPLFRTIRSFVN